MIGPYTYREVPLENLKRHPVPEPNIQNDALFLKFYKENKIFHYSVNPLEWSASNTREMDMVYNTNMEIFMELAIEK